jgi:hypothetical protein
VNGGRASKIDHFRIFLVRKNVLYECYMTHKLDSKASRTVELSNFLAVPGNPRAAYRGTNQKVVVNHVINLILGGLLKNKFKK